MENSNRSSKFEMITLPHGKSWIAVKEIIPSELCMNEDTFKRIWSLHPEQYETVHVWGKDRLTPRWQQNFGKEYYYSGRLHSALPITDPFLQDLFNSVKMHFETYRASIGFPSNTGKTYQQMLINWYQDGQHNIGWHSDDESQLLQNSPIYSFSYGQERDFDVRSKDNTYNRRFRVYNNSVIIMGGEMQKYYKHSVPKRAKSTCPGPRINITLRIFK